MGAVLGEVPFSPSFAFGWLRRWLRSQRPVHGQRMASLCRPFRTMHRHGRRGQHKSKGQVPPSCPHVAPLGMVQEQVGFKSSRAFHLSLCLFNPCHQSDPWVTVKVPFHPGASLSRGMRLWISSPFLIYWGFCCVAELHAASTGGLLGYPK